MQTTEITIQNFAAECACHCRHCLLRCPRGRTSGVAYERGERLTRRFAEWNAARENPLPLDYTVGYCADYPELTRNIALNLSLGSGVGKHILVNGLRARDDAGLRRFFADIKAVGAEQIVATLYGAEDYHDRFAARSGDFALMTRVITAAGEIGLKTNVGFIISEENHMQLSALAEHIENLRPDKIFGFLIDYRGRGEQLEYIRPTAAALAALPDRVRKYINPSRYKTYEEWRETEFEEETRRTLRLVLTADNIDRLEAEDAEKIIADLTALDGAYYSSLPPVSDLARLYGGEADPRLIYDRRNLIWVWRKRYYAEHGLTVYDPTRDDMTGAFRY